MAAAPYQKLRVEKTKLDDKMNVKSKIVAAAAYTCIKRRKIPICYIQIRRMP